MNAGDRAAAAYSGASIPPLPGRAEYGTFLIIQTAAIEEEVKMKRLSAIAMGLLVIGCTIAGCAYQPLGPAQTGWITLLDGTDMNQWNRVGDAN